MSIGSSRSGGTIGSISNCEDSSFVSSLVSSRLVSLPELVRTDSRCSCSTESNRIRSAEFVRSVVSSSSSISSVQRSFPGRCRSTFPASSADWRGSCRSHSPLATRSNWLKAFVSFDVVSTDLRKAKSNVRDEQIRSFIHSFIDQIREAKRRGNDIRANNATSRHAVPEDNFS